MHELSAQAINLLLLLTGPYHPATPPTDSSAVKVAVVTAIGVVLAAAMTAFASTFQRARSPRSTEAADRNFTKQYIDSLIKDQDELRKVQHIYTLLREGCLENNLDPDVLIEEQEESRRRDGRDW